MRIEELIRVRLLQWTLVALSLLVFTSCASSARGSRCGVSAPVDVIVESNHYYDVVVRDEMGTRLGVAPGLRTSRFQYCARMGGSSPVFLLDPIGGRVGHYLDGLITPEPGGMVVISIGAELRISFIAVLTPDAPPAP